MPRIRGTRSPCSRSRASTLPRPMPCSPGARAAACERVRRRAARSARRTRATSSGSSGSTCSERWTLPSPACPTMPRDRGLAARAPAARTRRRRRARRAGTQMSVERERRPGAAAAAAYADACRAAQSRVRAVGSRSCDDVERALRLGDLGARARGPTSTVALAARRLDEQATGRRGGRCPWYALIAAIVQASSSSTRVTPAPAATIAVAARQAASTSGNESRSDDRVLGDPVQPQRQLGDHRRAFPRSRSAGRGGRSRRTSSAPGCRCGSRARPGARPRARARSRASSRSAPSSCPPRSWPPCRRASRPRRGRPGRTARARRPPARARSASRPPGPSPSGRRARSRRSGPCG